MPEEPLTWHYGLVARWWAEFNAPAPEELAYYGTAIRRFGEPALDLACGAGRLLLPLLEDGLAVEGVDISADMLAQAAALARARGLEPILHRSALHEVDLGRRYRTIYCCDSFGLGGQRDHDVEALRRVFEHLEPGGAFVFNHYLPYDDVDEEAWARWLPGHRGEYPRAWPEEGSRKQTADGDEIELLTRAVEFSPTLQRRTLEMRARLWHEGSIIASDDGLVLMENLYFLQELLLMLRSAGFGTIDLEGLYDAKPMAPDAGKLVIVAHRAA